MKQIVQNLKNGKISVEDVPMPEVRKGCVLVENYNSLISAGTERSKLELGEKNIIQKALAKPGIVKEVIKKIRQEGIISTYHKIEHRLDSFSPLGYSCAGKVIAVGEGVKGVALGDRVACAGSEYAHHAEIVCIPINLVAKIPDNVNYEEASFTTLGAIALQGVRQTMPKLGDNVCVIGLGLLGQITVQLLNSCGCNAFGIDKDKAKIELASKLGAKKSISRDNDLENFSSAATSGFGFDAVIITAATPSNDPLIAAGKILRDRGKVVIVGDVKIDIPRKDYYEKEIEVIMSRSYGPGRYDPLYEEKGIDYPAGYVRWTEKRNMETILNLLSENKINFKDLITHKISIKEALGAYDIISGKTKEKYLGITIEYPPSSKDKDIKKIFVTEELPYLKGDSSIVIGFIGAGNFAKGSLLPYLKNLDVKLKGVATTTSANAKSVAQRYGFQYCAACAEEVLNDNKINTIFIVTRHNTHAHYLIEALKKGKNVYVEKPLAINEEELNAIVEVYNSLENKPLIMAGFNRRFSPLSVKMKEEFKDLEQSLVMNFRINAGFIPSQSWIQDDETGGGRIIGEICHFIDLMQYFTNSLPAKIHAEPLKGYKTQDNLSIIIKFKNGSMGNLIYLANGDPSLDKEHIEIFAGKKVFVNNNFNFGYLYKNEKRRKINLSGKGHKEELEAFITALREGKPSPITFKDLVYTTLTTFKIREIIKNGGGEVILE